MAFLNISVSLADEHFNQMLHSLSSINVQIEPSAVNLYRMLDTIAAGKPLRIFGTGCIRDIDPSALMSDGWDTFYLAKWVQANPGSTLDVVEIDPAAIAKCQMLLQHHGLDKFATIWLGDSLSFMEVWDQPVDVFVLDSCDGLEHGLEEFKSALNFNPRFIIMDDYEKKVKLAEQYAQSLNFPQQTIDRYTVFKTTK